MSRALYSSAMLRGAIVLIGAASGGLAAGGLADILADNSKPSASDHQKTTQESPSETETRKAPSRTTLQAFTTTTPPTSKDSPAKPPVTASVAETSSPSLKSSKCPLGLGGGGGGTAKDSAPTSCPSPETSSSTSGASVVSTSGNQAQCPVVGQSPLPFEVVGFDKGEPVYGTKEQLLEKELWSIRRQFPSSKVRKGEASAVEEAADLRKAEIKQELNSLRNI